RRRPATPIRRPAVGHADPQGHPDHGLGAGPALRGQLQGHGHRRIGLALNEKGLVERYCCPSPPAFPIGPALSLLPRQLLSVNVAQPSTMLIEGREILTGIRKRPVSTQEAPTPIEVKRMGLAGDDQADLTVHGGLSKAVYAYPHEHYA